VGTPQLWHFRISHYNEKVRWALDYKGWPHVRHALVPGWHHRTARRLTGQTQLPILELDGRLVHDSTSIIGELERLRPDPPLYPADPAARDRALAIEDYFDREVAPDLRRLFWSCYLPSARACARMSTAGRGRLAHAAFLVTFPLARPLFRRQLGASRAQVAAAKERLAGYFEWLEAELQPSGYLVGDTFTVADLTAAAVMTAIIRPPQFSYPLPEPWPRELVELRARIADRAGFRWVLDMYARHRGTSSSVAG
jgi:glutathione S-transferase